MWAPFPGDTSSCSSAPAGAAPHYHPYYLALGRQKASRRHRLPYVISNAAGSVQQIVPDAVTGGVTAYAPRQPSTFVYYTFSSLTEVIP